MSLALALFASFYVSESSSFFDDGFLVGLVGRGFGVASLVEMVEVVV